MPEGTEVTGQQGDLLAGASTEGAVKAPESTTGNQAATGTDVAAASSAAEGGKQPSQLDAVMAALGDGADASPAAGTVGQDKDTLKPEGDAAAQDAEPAESEDAKLPFATHPRFKQLLAHSKERKQLKAEVEPLRARVAELEPKAKTADSISNYAKQAGWTQEFFSNLLHMGRLMNDDPIAFYDAFKDQWGQIETMVGTRLPPDLQQKVNDGLMDEGSARELARQRSEAQLANTKLQRHTTQTAQERAEGVKREEQRQLEEFSNAAAGAASAWEKQWKSSDPDYAIKQPRVMKAIKLLMYENPPKSVEDAVALCNTARKEVEDDIRQLRPIPQAIRPNGSGTSVNAQGQPKDAVDAAMMALERMGSR